jgi:hypothetical protein
MFGFTAKHWAVGVHGGTGMALVFGDDESNARRFVACWNAFAAIDTLRAEEGSSVEIIHDNPDFDNGRNCAVVVRRNFEESGRTYYGETVVEALQAAVAGEAQPNG